MSKKNPWDPERAARAQAQRENRRAEINRHIRQADADYTARLQAREARERETQLAAGWDPDQGTRAWSKSSKRRAAIKTRHRRHPGNAHLD